MTDQKPLEEAEAANYDLPLPTEAQMAEYERIVAQADDNVVRDLEASLAAQSDDNNSQDKEMGMENRFNKALLALADQIDHGHLLLATDAVTFVDTVTARLDTANRLRSERNAAVDRISAAEAENGELKVLLARQKLRSEQLEGLLDKAAGLYSDDWPDQFQRGVEAALADAEAQDA